jgi:Nif-specific regulatory protein
VLTTTDGVIHGYSLPPTLQMREKTEGGAQREGEAGAGLGTLVEAYEREIIVDALKKSRGVVAAAARSLRTTERILNYRIRRMGIVARTYR